MSARKPPFELGVRFGDWEVIAQEDRCIAPRSGQVRELFSRVRCACGKEKTLSNNYLRAGRSNGCGCRRARAFTRSRTKHNKSRSQNYGLWSAIKHRLKHLRSYDGIHMYEPWARDFSAFDRFIDSLGPKPTPQHTLDRIESTGHYEPGNLRWADKKTQSENRKFPDHITQPSTRGAHGCTDTPLYRTWMRIKNRLREDRNYENVRMHESWVTDFPAFEAYIESLGPKPTPQHTLDRIESTGHYEPGNLRWADKKTQSENRRNNKHRQVLTKSLVAVGEKHGMLTVLALLVERRHGVTWYCAEVRCDCGTVKTVYQKQLINGRTRSCGCFKNQNIRLGHKALEKPITVDDRTMSMSAWAREKGISKHVIWTRIHVGGWDPARAVTTPVREEASVQVNDESLTLSECSSRHGVPVRVIRKRLSKGWDPLAAVTTPVRAWGLNRA